MSTAPKIEPTATKASCSRPGNDIAAELVLVLVAAAPVKLAEIALGGDDEAEAAVETAARDYKYERPSVSIQFMYP